MNSTYIWYNISQDKLFEVPFTPTNYTYEDIFYFNIKFWDKCLFLGEL